MQRPFKQPLPMSLQCGGCMCHCKPWRPLRLQISACPCRCSTREEQPANSVPHLLLAYSRFACPTILLMCSGSSIWRGPRRTPPPPRCLQGTHSMRRVRVPADASAMHRHHTAPWQPAAPMQMRADVDVTHRHHTAAQQPAAPAGGQDKQYTAPQPAAAYAPGGCAQRAAHPTSTACAAPRHSKLHSSGQHHAHVTAPHPTAQSVQHRDLPHGRKQASEYWDVTRYQQHMLGSTALHAHCFFLFSLRFGSLVDVSSRASSASLQEHSQLLQHSYFSPIPCTPAQHSTTSRRCSTLLPQPALWHFSCGK